MEDVLAEGTDPLDELVARFAATHVPFEAGAVSQRLGIPLVRVTAALNRLEAAKRVTRGAFRPDGSGTEWCDVGVLRTVRRRSLARLRSEVEPVAPEAYARFLCGWHSIDRPRRGADALADAITQLAGAPVPVSILETDVLPARVARYSAADLDALLSSGELVWIGAGALGPNDGRIRLYWRDELATLAPPPETAPQSNAMRPPSARDKSMANAAGREEAGRHVTDTTDPDSDDEQTADAWGRSDPVEQALLRHLDVNGAAFWPDLLSAAAAGDGDPDGPTTSAAPRMSPVTSADFSARVLTALWDLVWAGLVTNDTLAPLRALGPRRAAKRQRSAAGRAAGARVPASSSRHGARRGRPGVLSRSGPRQRPGRLRAAGPPSAAGRWSLTSLLREPAPSATERAHGTAQALLERHGIVTRSGVLAEGHPGGFAAAYGILRALEERGSVRRGHFIEGLGASQFATAAAVERLRDHRESSGEPVLLAAADPTQPYGAALRWPPSDGRPSRTAGAHAVLADGIPLVLLDRGGRTLHTFEHTATDLRWISTLRDALATGRIAKVELARIDATPAAEHPIHDRLLENGFTPGYRGPTLHP